MSDTVMSHKGYAKNEYGTDISVHVCHFCGAVFTVCPPKSPDDEGWDGCMGVGCESYDVQRDVDLMFEVEPWRINSE